MEFQLMIILACCYILEVHASCSRPPNSVLHQQWLQTVTDCGQPSLANSPVFSQVSEMAGQLHHATYCQNRDRPCNPQTDPRCATCGRPTYGEDTCPTTTPQSVLPEDLSICPYLWYQTTVETRYPRTVSEARCRCRDCRHGDLDSEFGCVAIHHTVPVLYQTNQTNPNGQCKFESKLAKLAVGCTCVKTIQ